MGSFLGSDGVGTEGRRRVGAPVAIVAIAVLCLLTAASASASTAGEIASLPTLDALKRSERPLSNEGKWSALAWDASSSTNKTGQDTASGWGPADIFPTVNGAYWNRAKFSDLSGGDAAEITMQIEPGLESRYVALWLDMPDPGTIQSGYQLSWTELAEAGKYTVTLSKWSSGIRTVLASSPAVSIPIGTTLAISDTGSVIEAWKGSGGNLTSFLTASDSAYSAGYVGMEGAGANSRSAAFQAGGLVGKAISGMSVLDNLQRQEVPLANGKWSQPTWAANIGGAWNSFGWLGFGSPNSTSISGAYWNPTTVSDAFGGDGVAATMTVAPSDGQYLALWLNMPTPGTAQSGYEARWTYRSANGAYDLELSKWTSGTRAALAAKSSFSIPLGTTIALTENGGDLTIWTGTGTFTPALAANDANPYTSGYAGLQCFGGAPTEDNFQAGSLGTPPLTSVPVIDALNRNESSLSNGGKWSALAWDSATSTHKTGQDTSEGWGPWDAFSNINGAYWNASTFSDSGLGEAAELTFQHSPEYASRYASVWLNMSSPASTQSGYQLKWALNSEFGSTYTVSLLRWSSGSQTVLASNAAVSISSPTTLVIVDVGGTVEAWRGSGGSFSPLLSAADSTYSSGYAGIEASGNISRSINFQAGSLSGPTEPPAMPAMSSVNPASPANNNSPKVIGTAAAGSTVQLYANATCTGAPTAAGSAATFASPGIAASVADNTTTTFSATASNAAGMSACSTSNVTYTEDSTPPTSPILSSTSPPSGSNNNQPKVTGSAEGSSTVKLYTNGTCTGSPAATGSAATFASPGLTVSVSDNTTTTFYGTATDLAGNTSACSASSVTYKEFSPAFYWGAWENALVEGKKQEAPFDMSVQEAFETEVGRTASIIHWSAPWFSTQFCGGSCEFQPGDFNKVRTHGSIPFFSWAPGGVSSTDRQIAEGAQDAYVTKWAEAAKAWGHPFFLRFAWEMNGNWFHWGVGNSEANNTAADYVAMWKHVHDVFASVGATNVTWVWCPNIDPAGSISSLYPGDSYVDWTCLDGYNGDNPWRSFSELFGAPYSTLVAVAPSKPTIIGETASTEAGGSKASWITQMFGQLFSNVHGLLWFNKINESGPGGHSDWPIESSPSATAAFASGIQNGPFAAASYSNLNTSPIPATP
jgi:hypothetical protein